MAIQHPSKLTHQQVTDASAPHPVLNRSAKLHERTQALGLGCIEPEWLGWNIKHRFVCAQGHALQIAPENLLNRGGACRLCQDSVRFTQLQALAAAANAVCLDSAWHGHQAIYRFRCGQGHEWSRSAKHRPGCPVCIKAAADERRRLKDGLQRLVQAARARGGVCLSKTYLGRSQYHRFRCAEGHEWQSTDVLRGVWCGPCASAAKRTQYRLADGLARLQQAAADKGGLCLSEAYEGSKYPYRFRCSKGHEWQTLGARILLGGWCLPCAHDRKRGRSPNPHGLLRLQEVAVNRGGVCLSEAYLGSYRHHRFRCSKGHEWEALATSFLQGTWCSECRYDKARLGIEAAQAAARERGGQCLSTTYPMSTTKMNWMCHRGHTWQALFAKIRAGQWCPQCARLARITTGGPTARQRYEVAGYAA